MVSRTRRARLETACAALTDRQREVYEYISRQTAAHGFPPTVREIGDALGIRSPNGVTCHLKALIRKGLLRRKRNCSRGLVLCGERSALQVLRQAARNVLSAWRYDGDLAATLAELSAVVDDQMLRHLASS